MCAQMVTVVTSLTVPAPVVGHTGMSTESEDSDSLMPQPVNKVRQATLRFGPSHPCDYGEG